MPILYNVGNKLTAGSEPPQLYRYQDRVLGDGGTLETRDEASTFIRRLRSAGVLGSTVIAGVAGGVKAGTLYSIIGPDLDVTRGTVKNRVNRAGVLNQVASGVPATDFAGGVLRGTTVEPSAVNQIRNNTMQGAVVGSPGTWG
jgi:PII-like signaling protein